MKLRIIIFLCAICLYSCNNNNKKIKLICNNQIKYWDVIAPKINQKGYVRGYCFYNNGYYEKFYYYKNKRYNDDAIDIALDTHWKCLNDSFIILNRKAYILKLTKDSFVYQFNDKSIIRLVKSKNQTNTINPPERKSIIDMTDTVYLSR